MRISKKILILFIIIILSEIISQTYIRLNFKDFDGAAYSPDGFLTISRTKIYKVKEDGSGIHAVTSPKPGLFDFDPVYSHDSKKMAFGRGTTLPLKSQIYIISADGEETQITHDDFSNGSPAFSLDDKRIYYIRTDLTSKNASPSEYSIALDGTDLRQEKLPEPYRPVVPPGCRPPFYSPDGKLRVINGFIEEIATGKKIKIPKTFRRNSHMFTFSPDSKRIIFFTGDNYTQLRLWSVNSDGSHLTDLSPRISKALSEIEKNLISSQL